jgi:hypothetical protein
MSDVPDKDDLIRRLRINDPEFWSVLDVLASMTERQRCAILRPHSDAGFSSETEERSMMLRENLDQSLGVLTLIEIACELGLISASDLTALQSVSFQALCQSDSFLRFLEAYLYFGVRLLAGRLFPPDWWNRGNEFRLRESDFNRRSLQLAAPPTVGDAAANRSAFERFLDIFESDTQAIPAKRSSAVFVALGFLDGFYNPKLKPRPEIAMNLRNWNFGSVVSVRKLTASTVHDSEISRTGLQTGCARTENSISPLRPAGPTGPMLTSRTLPTGLPAAGSSQTPQQRDSRSLIFIG